MLNVKVYPDLYSPHHSQIYSGLSDLAKEGKIDLKFTSRFESEVKTSIPNSTLWLQVTDSENGKGRNVCFDLFDGCEISSIQRLRLCDVYFKRSFSEQSLSKLDSIDRAKVHPYGLNHECRSINERQILRRLIIFHLSRRTLFKNPGRFINHLATEIVRYFLLKLNIDVFNLKPISCYEFLVKPGEPAEPTILFQTRLWSSHETPRISESRLNELNDMRVKTVRILKNKFAGRFIGGLIPTDYARQYYPDLLAVEKTNRRDYLNLVKRCLICVTSTGLHDSIGFKLPEYLAASRCIVSEPINFQLPVSLKEGGNYLSYRTPEECVEACEKILSNSKFADQMRQDNYEYYLEEVLPPKLLFKRLNTALNWPRRTAF